MTKLRNFTLGRYERWVNRSLEVSLKSVPATKASNQKTNVVLSLLQYHYKPVTVEASNIVCSGLYRIPAIQKCLATTCRTSRRLSSSTSLWKNPMTAHNQDVTWHQTQAMKSNSPQTSTRQRTSQGKLAICSLQGSRTTITGPDKTIYH